MESGKQLSNELRSFIVNNFLFGDGALLGDTDSFMEKGLIDSTGILELVSFIEQTYAITVEPEELVPDNFDSLAKLTEFADRKKNGLASDRQMKEA